MNRNVMLLIGALVLVVIGAGVYTLTQKTNSTPLSENKASTPSDQKSPQKSQKSLKDLIASSGSQKCTFKDKSDEYDMEGIAYVSNGKMRGDFSIKSPSSVLSHMIVDNNTVYQWVDGETVGFKTSYDPNQPAPTGSVQSVDVNQYVDYDCSPTSVDATLFTPPSNVRFQEMQASAPSTGVSGNQCASCNYLSGEQKTKCLEALKCN